MLCSFLRRPPQTRAQALVQEMREALSRRRALGILPPGAVSAMQADTTLTTSAAGLPKDLSSPRLALSRLFSAASASRMTGSAASRSCVHSSWNAVTSACAHAESPEIIRTNFSGHILRGRAPVNPECHLRSSRASTGCPCYKTDSPGHQHGAQKCTQPGQYEGHTADLMEHHQATQMLVCETAAQSATQETELGSRVAGSACRSSMESSPIAHSQQPS